jgi:hypothetical protein
VVLWSLHALARQLLYGNMPAQGLLAVLLVQSRVFCRAVSLKLLWLQQASTAGCCHLADTLCSNPGCLTPLTWRRDDKLLACCHFIVTLYCVLFMQGLQSSKADSKAAVQARAARRHD